MFIEEQALPRDPSTGIITGAEPYYMEGTAGMPAVLLIHGFGGIPYDLRLVADELNGLGYTVSGPLLSGHGTSAEDMATTGWEDWYGSAEREYLRLSGSHDTVYVVGFSMGGLLALNLSIEHDFEGLVLLAPCVFLPGEDDLISTEYMIDNISPYLPGEYIISDGGKTVEPDALKDRHAYTLFPMSCLRSLVELMKLTRPRINEVDEPLIVIQSVSDGTVGAEGPDYILDHAITPKKEAVRVDNSRHHLARDSDKDIVIAKVVDFIENDQ
jgi:carboxylesterase